MRCQAGCKVPIKGLLDPWAPLLAIRPSVLELQFWNDPMDPVIVGGDPDVDTWAVPAGAALTPADDPSLQPRLAFEAHQRAPRVSLQRKQRHCQSPQGPRSQQAHRWTYTPVFLPLSLSASCPTDVPAQLLSHHWLLLPFLSWSAHFFVIPRPPAWRDVLKSCFPGPYCRFPDGLPWAGSRSLLFPAD